MVARTNTRDKVLTLLKREHQLSVKELAQLLNISEVAVRKHLNTLERDSLIQINEIKQPMGRPLQVYSLTSKSEERFPKNYESMTVEFLHDLQESQGNEVIDFLFDKRQDRLEKEYLSNMLNKNPEQKVTELAKIQNEKGYMTELTKIDDDSYELIEYNCPIFSVASHFKKACRCETAMFQNVLGTKHVDRVCCQTDGETHCKFSIQFNN
ncbi:metalloregulator ArsR/SmtB family transcription factor [Bacillus sp. SRB_331]|uniref:helix-turn-helix transcriptional regulator n=1 Tax=Bacillus sp. SRB_331 TaxID=1969379 RepID=UPI000DC3E4DF|nr:metalloregulator ArsR/SmtB family transcription factor [Bacillus sp. SRB_331]RAN80590.1 transcriptional regulator [Bacillus sp. SRB_331]RAN86771.1 transcriptional regulator [Bacillus sp. SRB_28]